MPSAYTSVDALTGPLIGRPRMATFRLADFTGVDICLYVASNLYDLVPEHERRVVYAPPGFVKQMVAKGLDFSEVTLVGNTLTATTSGMDYQWVDCNNGNEPIEGATAQSFEATQSGSYAVILTSGTCAQTSACTAGTITGTADLAGPAAFAVYPNPFQEVLLVRSNSATGPVRVELFSAAGQLHLDETRSGLELITVNTAQLPAGSYIVRLTANDLRSTFPVVK